MSSNPVTNCDAAACEVKRHKRALEPKGERRFLASMWMWSALKYGSMPSKSMLGKRARRYAEVRALFTPTSPMCK
eukprot:CAMPEP_0171148102 /NCGR_PEP_ID=MMETSP0766_2-20121228/148397_1 /TAXON_ID=439317 /ORGANISM="Gambierdiscus australes, Strain CAWD 149" /LENGTH=74 /DNA_ID=CAMNT_0011612011 /DNA_START=273 /DNA_END=497 /DNA_ORIENTATION=+